MRAGYTAISLIALTPTVVIAQLAEPRFFIQDRYTGNDFLTGWNWETMNDPTHGRVNYVDNVTAVSKNLASVSSGNTFIMRADSTNMVTPDSRGRDSIRITSQKAYQNSLIVLDLVHMPEGLATWPAFWTLSQQGPWPNGGEIDIIEGVNQNENNLVSLHTTPNCTISPLEVQAGNVQSTDCNAAVNYNQGCGVSSKKVFTYGSDFNRAGGGWYAMERQQNAGIKVWFWSRNDPTVPRQVSSADRFIQPDDTWGIPIAHFGFETCDYELHFDAHALVFDLTLCGDWAGNDYKTHYSKSDTDTCESFVDNNPQAFANAYWEINSLNVWFTP